MRARNQEFFSLFTREGLARFLVPSSGDKAVSPVLSPVFANFFSKNRLPQGLKFSQLIDIQ